MNNVQKNAIYSLFLIVVFVSIYYFRDASKANPSMQMYIEGETMGTTYHIKYLDVKGRDFKKGVDSLLVVFNQSLSTYQPDSEISKFNQDSVFVFQLPFFYPVLKKSHEVYLLSKGAFDPTVAPLVNFWGFGFKKIKSLQPDSTAIDSLLAYVSFEKYIRFDEKSVRKLKKGVQLDFNAIAQGYGTDVVAQFIEKQGVTNYMVEVGGEVLCKGKNLENKIWSIGISNPKNDTELKATVELNNRALATSGNYRKFYVKGGRKYAHTLNPKTGFPVLHSLLSASVFAPDAMTADAIATTFMVVGVDKAKEMLKTMKDVDVYLVYADEKGELQTFISEGIRQYLKE